MYRRVRLAGSICLPAAASARHAPGGPRRPVTAKTLASMRAGRPPAVGVALTSRLTSQPGFPGWLVVFPSPKESGQPGNPVFRAVLEAAGLFIAQGLAV